MLSPLRALVLALLAVLGSAAEGCKSKETPPPDPDNPAAASAAAPAKAPVTVTIVYGRALAFGLRPGDPSVPVKSADAQNPWSRLAPYGIQIDIPPVAKTPDGAVARNLMTMWTRLVGSDAR